MIAAEVAMEGWRPVEDLVGWGFAHAPVVMANEAHSGVDALVVSTDNALTEDPVNEDPLIGDRA